MRYKFVYCEKKSIKFFCIIISCQIKLFCEIFICCEIFPFFVKFSFFVKCSHFLWNFRIFCEIFAFFLWNLRVSMKFSISSQIIDFLRNTRFCEIFAFLWNFRIIFLIFHIFMEKFSWSFRLLVTFSRFFSKIFIFFSYFFEKITIIDTEKAKVSQKAPKNLKFFAVFFSCRNLVLLNFRTFSWHLKSWVFEISL